MPGVALVILTVIVVLGKLTVGGGGKTGIPLRPGFMCMVLGLRGGGKSLFCARLIAQRLAAGMPVVANFPVVGLTAIRMRSWEDVILAPPRSTVFLDEVQNWAGSSSRAGADRIIAEWYISHSRKLDHEVWVISQDETLVAPFVRNQVNEIVECRKLIRGRHRAQSFAPKTYGKAKAKCLWAWWYRPEGPAIKVYDTMELVRPVVKAKRPTEDEQVAKINELIDEIYRRRGLDPDADVLDLVVVEPEPEPELVDA